MQFKSLIEKITTEFIHHWNNHDMDKLAAFLSNDVVVHSPNIRKLYPEMKEDVLHQKENVIRYWEVLNKEHFYELKFQTLHKEDKVITCEVHAVNGQMKMLATFTINEYGKFVFMDISYQ